MYWQYIVQEVPLNTILCVHCIDTILCTRFHYIVQEVLLYTIPCVQCIDNKLYRRFYLKLYSVSMRFHYTLYSVYTVLTLFCTQGLTILYRRFHRLKTELAHVHYRAEAETSQGEKQYGVQFPMYRCTVYSVQRTVCGVQCGAYSLWLTMSAIQCAVQIVGRTFWSLQLVAYNLRQIGCRVQCATNSLRRTVWAVYSVQRTVCGIQSVA